MERKNYLVEKLSKEENIYFKRIIMSARNLYFKKNRKFINTNNVEFKEAIFETESTLVESIFERGLKEMKSAQKFEETISNPALCKYVKALSLREKEVLFYLFWEEKEINETAQIMGMHRNGIRKIRDRVIEKITKNMLKGEE